MKRQLQFISFWVFWCVVLALPNQVKGQDPVSVSTAQLVNTFPTTLYDINTSNGGSASGMQGPCSTLPCCSVYVYKVELPTYGSFRMDMSNFAPLAGSMVAYKPLVDNPTSWDDLSHIPVVGNFCGFRDTLQLGHGYNWAGNHWKDYMVHEVYDHSDPDGTASYFEPGDYYVLVFGKNQQISFGNNIDITFRFVPYCPDGYTCDFVSETICDSDSYLSPAGNIYTSSGNYTDTLVGAGVGGVDSLVFINLNFIQNNLVQSNIVDFSDCEGVGTSFEASTSYVSYAQLDKSQEEWIEVNSLVDTLTNRDRSVFAWIKKGSTVSGSSQVIVGINTSSGGNVCNMQVGTNEKFGVYDGSNSHYTNKVVTDGEWHFVGYTYNEEDNETKMWVDGELSGTYTNSQSISSTNKLSLGQEFDGGLTTGNFYDGIITEVSFWDTVLVESDINLLMQEAISNTHPQYDNLRGYYPMNTRCGESDMDLILDHSGNNFQAYASDATITDETMYLEIPNFNSTKHYDISWKNGSNEVSNLISLELTGDVSETGSYSLEMSKDFVKITDEFSVNFEAAPVFTSQPVDIISPLGTDVTFEAETNVQDAVHHWFEMDPNYMYRGFPDGLPTSFLQDICMVNGTIYVASYTDGIGISTDRGESFTTINSSNSNLPAGNYQHVVVIDNSIFVNVWDIGIHRSDDNGATWNLVPGTSFHSALKKITELNAVDGKLYVKVQAGGTGFYSLDKGASFLFHNYIMYENIASYQGEIYYPTNDGVKVSSDEGLTTSSHFLTGLTCRDIYINDTIIIVATNAGLYISKDDGVTFSLRTVDEGMSTDYCTNVHLLNNRIYVGHNSGFSVSEDGGDSFYTENPATGGFMVPGNVRGMVSDESRLYIANTGNALTNFTIKADSLFVGADKNLELINITDDHDGKRYVCKATNPSNSCSSFSDIVTLTVGSPGLTANISELAAITCNNGSDGSLTVNGLDGSEPYTYLWSNGATTQSISGLNAGTYSVTITDADGDTAIDSFELSQPDAMEITFSEFLWDEDGFVITGFTTTCYESYTGGINSAVDGGAAPYIYSWDNGATTASIVGLNAGTYTLTVTDQDGCQVVDSQVISEPDPITGTDTRTEIAPFTWIDGNVYTADNNTATHILEAANGCDSTVTLDLTIYEPLVAYITVDNNVTCNGGSDGNATLNISGGVEPYTYVVTGASGGETGIQYFQSFEGDASDNWNYQVYPATYNTEGDLIATGSNDIWAIMQEFVGDIDSAYHGTHFWGTQDLNNSNGGGQFQHTVTFDPVDVSSLSDATLKFNYYSDGFDSADSIAYEVHFDNGTIWGTDSIPLGKNTDQWDTISVAIPETADFVRLRFWVSQNGSSDYSGWDNVRIESATGSGSLNDLPAGSYNVTVTDNDGTEALTSFGLSEPAEITGIDTRSELAPFTWIDGNVYTDDNTTATHVLTAANGCDSTVTLNLTIITYVAPSVTIIIDSLPSCNGYVDGGLTAQVTGGTAPYTYLWSNSATTATIVGVMPMEYTVTVTDADGTVVSDQVMVTQPDALSNSFTELFIDDMGVTGFTISCNGDYSGGIIANAAGGTAPYSYLWNNSATTASIAGVNAGEYTVTITDANGCVHSDTKILTEPAAITGIDVQEHCTSYTWIDGVTYTESNNTATHILEAVNGCDSVVTLNLTILESTVGVDVQEACESFTWIDGITYTESNFTATHVLTNAVGCDSVVTLNLTIGDNINPVASTQNIDLYLDIDGVATLTADEVNNGSTDNCELASVSIDQEDFTCAHLGANILTLTATDASGNMDTETATVNVFDTIAPIVITQNIQIELNADGQAFIDVTDIDNGSYDNCTASLLGEPFYLSQTEFSCEHVGENTVTLFAADNYGNESSATAIVTVVDPVAPVIPVIEDKVVGEGENCSGLLEDYTIDLAVTDNCEIESVVQTPAPGTQYELNNQVVEVTITATDISGNSSVETFNVLFEDAWSFDITGVDVTHVTNCPVWPEEYNSEIVIHTTLDSNYLQFQVHEGFWQYYNNHFPSLDPDTYHIKVRNNNGCIKEWADPVVVNPAEEIVINEVILNNDNLCNGAADASIEVLATGGNGTLEYSIDGGLNWSFESVFNNLGAGDYTIVVRDQGGCEMMDDEVYTITNPDAIMLTNVNVTGIQGCSGTTNGSIIIEAEGGAGFLEYSIDNGNNWQFEASFENLGAGSYNVIVKDQNDCTTEYTQNPIVLEDPSELYIDHIGISELVCDSETAVINIVAIGGSGGWEWSIDNGLTWIANDEFTIESGVEYDLMVRDMYGCEAAWENNPYSFEAIYSTPVEMEISPESLVCVGESITIKAIAEGELDYFWTPDGQLASQIVVSEEAGVYEYGVVVTNESGCETIANVEVEFQDCTSVNAISEENIMIYPNPNQGNFTMTFSNELPERIVIVSTLGQVVEMIDNVDLIQNEMSFDFVDLTAGMYFIKCEYKDARLIIKKVTIKD